MSSLKLSPGMGGIMEARNNRSVVSSAQEAAYEKPIGGREWVTPEFHRMDLNSARGTSLSEDAKDLASNT